MPENEITNKFRLGMRNFVYSVSVVSNYHQGKINAITVSSVTSVSLDPPSVVVSVNKKSSVHPSLISDSIFCYTFKKELGIHRKHYIPLT